HCSVAGRKTLDTRHRRTRRARTRSAIESEGNRMSDDKYVPDHEMVRECWIDWSASCGIGRKTAHEEFERFIADVKADAWDDGLQAGWEECQNPGPFVNDW